ncbi:MAG: hypothetical protein V4721_00460 [Bacteroidota bacterium]
MESYKCTVRLSGELGQEVPKNGISAAHIGMLMKEHGDDAVHSIEKVAHVLEWPRVKPKELENGRISKTKVVTQAMMREFLEHEFGEVKVGVVFGTFYGAVLPDALPGFGKTKAMPKKTVQKAPAAANNGKKTFEDRKSFAEQSNDDDDDEIDTDSDEDAIEDHDSEIL